MVENFCIKITYFYVSRNFNFFSNYENYITTLIRCTIPKLLKNEFMKMNKLHENNIVLLVYGKFSV